MLNCSWISTKKGEKASSSVDGLQDVIFFSPLGYHHVTFRKLDSESGSTEPVNPYPQTFIRISVLSRYAVLFRAWTKEP
jgi:hypothetical protein